MSSEEQHRRAGEPFEDEPPSQDEPSFKEERVAGSEPLPQEEVFEPIKMRGAEDPEVSPLSEEAYPEVEDEEPDTDDLEQKTEILREEILSLTRELESARKEKDEYLDNARRLKAELENSRKRQERERVRLTQLASERLVRELLPVLDNLERALEAGGDIREGVRATRDQLVAVLKEEGLAPVASEGQSFDPAVHEAVIGQPSDEHEEDTILQTLERGYILNGKPIRPAKVVVAKQI